MPSDLILPPLNSQQGAPCSSSRSLVGAAAGQDLLLACTAGDAVLKYPEKGTVHTKRGNGEQAGGTYCREIESRTERGHCPSVPWSWEVRAASVAAVVSPGEHEGLGLRGRVRGRAGDKCSCDR